MDVTVVLSGIPYPEITFYDLVYHLKKLFDTDDIGTFKVRDLLSSNHTSKWQVALDFTSGYDAMYAQNLLDGKSFHMNGVINVLRARVTRDPKLMPDVPLSKCLVSSSQARDDSSSSSADDSPPAMSKTKSLMKADRKIDAKLNLLDIKKKVIMTEEEQLLLEREKLRRELELLSEEEDTPPRKRRYSSDVEDENSGKQKVKPSHKRKINSSLSLKDTSSHDLTRKCPRGHRDSSASNQRGSSPCDTLGSSHSRALKRKKPSKRRVSSPCDQCDSSPCDTPGNSHSRALKRKKSLKQRVSSPSDQHDSSPCDTPGSPHSRALKRKEPRKRSVSSPCDQCDSSPCDTPGNSHSRALKRKELRKQRVSSPSDQRDSSPCDTLGSSHSRDLKRKDPRKHTDSSYDQRDSSSHDTYCNPKGSSSRDLRGSSSRDFRDRLNNRHDKSKTKVKSLERLIHVARRGSEKSVRIYREESRSHSRSRSKERFSYKTSGIISLRKSPTRPSNRHSEIRKRIPKDRAIEYRPNISEAHHSEKCVSTRTSQNSREELTTECIIINKDIGNTETELEIKMEQFKAKRDELKAKQDEAIKDILFELKEQFTDLCMKNNIVDTDKSRVLHRMFDIVDKRMRTCRLTSAMTVSDLVMHYRCKHSKIEDKDLVTELFSELISTQNKTLESASTSAVNNKMWDALDSVLDKFELPTLTEDVKPNIEEETDSQEINIINNLNPITTNENTKQFQVKDGDYYINVTIHPNRPKKFYITIKIIIKNMKTHMKKYESYVEYELFEYIIRGILEKQIAMLLEGKPYMPAKELYNYYRESYPQEGDEDFVLQTLYEIWEGLYNDPVVNKDDTPDIKVEATDRQFETISKDKSVKIEEKNVTDKVVDLSMEDVLDINISNNDYNSDIKLEATDTELETISKNKSVKIENITDEIVDLSMEDVLNINVSNEDDRAESKLNIIVCKKHISDTENEVVKVSDDECLETDAETNSKNTPGHTSQANKSASIGIESTDDIEEMKTVKSEVFNDCDENSSDTLVLDTL